MSVLSRLKGHAVPIPRCLAISYYGLVRLHCVRSNMKPSKRMLDIAHGISTLRPEDPPLSRIPYARPMSSPSAGPHGLPSELGFPWDAGSAVHHPPALRARTVESYDHPHHAHNAAPGNAQRLRHARDQRNVYTHWVLQRNQALAILVDNRASTARLNPWSAGLELESPRVARMVVTGQTALAIDEVPLCVLARRAIELGGKTNNGGAYALRLVSVACLVNAVKSRRCYDTAALS